MDSAERQAHGRHRTTLREKLKGAVLASRAAILILVAPAGIAAQQPSTATSSLVFDGVTVVDVEQGELIPDQRVVIRGDRIDAVGDADAVTTPPEAQVVAAAGQYLIPGLWDMHTHAARSTESFYPLFLANGVTGIRDAGSPVPLDTLRLWRREILANTRLGPPRQVLSGQSIMDGEKNCDRSRRQREHRLQLCVADSADARHVVDSLKAAGADMIKPRAVKHDMYFVIAAEARRLGIPFGGHAQDETAIEASDSGARIIDHDQVIMKSKGLRALCITARSASVEQCQPIADRLKRNDTWVVLDASTSGAWSKSGNLHLIQRVGLPILAGTDISGAYLGRKQWSWNPKRLPGATLHKVLADYVTAGLTPLEALQSATLNPATMLHGTDSLGTVAPGKLADLVLLGANPLEDITNTTTIRAVVANGRYFDRTALDSLSTEVQAKTNGNP